VRLASGQPLAAKGRQGVPAGQTVIFETPGGGGLGDPDARAAELRESDRVAGLVDT
jgi:N-methylhydantoinase B